MKRLRHPVRAIREPFGKAGLTVAICALVMALVGGAYAAGGLTKAQEKQVTKIAKKYAGKPGTPGAAGTNGTNGTNGKDGAPGSNGAPGPNGADGKSVVVSNSAPICTEGGITIEVEDSGEEDQVCNGEQGSPWTAGGTLPPEATETGTWSSGVVAKPEVTSQGPEDDVEVKLQAPVLVPVPISFAIPLADPIPASNVDILAPNETTATCSGSGGDPTAAPGYLCVYVTIANELTYFNVFPVDAALTPASTPGASVSGAIAMALSFNPPASNGYIYGSWAVTAPAE